MIDIQVMRSMTLAELIDIASRTESPSEFWYVTGYISAMLIERGRREDALGLFDGDDIEDVRAALVKLDKPGA